MTRLYHPDDLFADKILMLDEKQTHYLRHVLRAKPGYQLTVFNEREGEWSAVLTAVSKVSTMVTIEAQLRTATLVPDVSLFFAPLKHDALTFLVEKATELGVRYFRPVLTERCPISRINHDRLKSNAIEAAQQCERFDIPVIYPLMPLNKALETWTIDVPLFICQERGEATTVARAFGDLKPKTPIGLFIGPEGGMTTPEIAYFKSFSFTRFMNLGPRILRAETAALAALTCYQALTGDWDSSSRFFS